MTNEVKIPKQVQDRLIQFESLQKQLQLMVLQKQQLNRQLAEIKNALDELEKTEKGGIYRAVGPLLIETNKPDSKKKLTEEQNTINVRVKMLETEEKKMTDRLNEMRTEIQGMLQGLQGTEQLQGG